MTIFFFTMRTWGVLVFTLLYCVSDGILVKTSNVLGRQLKCDVPQCTCVSRNSKVKVNCTGVTSPGKRDRKWELPTNTTSLIVEKSNVSAIPWESLSHLSLLRIMQLRDCSVRDSSELLLITQADFSANITSLNLRHNKLQKVDARLLSLFPAMEHLYLSFNNITVIEKGCFRMAPRLAYLDLSSNSIGPALTRPDALAGLQHLRELRLENCSIWALHRQVFLDLKNLRYLYLAHNHFTAIPVSTLVVAPRLIFLNLAFNKISTVDDDFSRLHRLKYLFLHNNHLQAIYPGALDGFDSLQQIVLNNNQLRTLPLGLQPALQQMPRLHDISLVNVTWHCDCHLLWLVRLEQMAAMTSSLTAPSVSRCHWPRHLKGKSLRELSLPSLRCPKLPGCEEGKLASIRCQWCPPFQKPVAGGSQCVCMEGYEFVPHALPVCQPCPDGYFKADVTNGPCVQCPAHSATLTSGASVCHCVSGYTLSATQHCHPCPANTFKSNLGNHVCHRCPLNSQGPPGSDSLQRCRCLQPHHYVSTDDSQCVTDRHDVSKRFCGVEGDVHQPLPTDRGRLVVGRPENPSATTPMKVDSVKGSSDQPSTMKSGVVMAISIAVAVVVATLLGILLSLLLSRRLPCHTTHNLFAHSSMLVQREPEVTIDTNLVSYCPPEPKFYIRRLRIGQLIGRGAFGQVHAGLLFTIHDKVKKTLSVAVKRLKDKSSEDEDRALQAELEQMILVGHHPNIIQLIGSCVHKGQLHIIMEMAEGGDLLTYLRQGKVRHEQYVSVGPDGSLREQQTLEVTGHQDLMLFVWHIAKGMSYLESVKCIHRDLAARNCLITAGPVAKLSDFGLSRDVYESGYYFRRFKGRVPFKWLSPEAFLWGQYSSKSDVWSYGILLWEVATLGGTPYPGVPPDKIADMHRSRHRLPQPPACPDTLYRVMRSCWHEDPRRRPSFRSLCDVMEAFVQGATENKYLELQDLSHITLPELTPETEQPTHRGLPLSCPSDVTSSSYSPGVHHSTGSSPHQSAPRTSLTPHRPPQEKTQPPPHCRLPVKTRPLAVVHSLGWSQEEAGDSGQHMDMSEEGMELQPMLGDVCAAWAEGGSSESAALPCLSWEKGKGDLRETCWTSGYSSSLSGAGLRLDSGDGKDATGS